MGRLEFMLKMTDFVGPLIPQMFRVQELGVSINEGTQNGWFIINGKFMKIPLELG